MEISQINNSKLLELNKLGIIPGPNELEDDFFKRAEFCLNIKQRLADELEKSLPFSAEDLDSSMITDENKFTLYDNAPQWMPVFFNNHQLSLWHGGCAWIFQLTQETPVSALLQLRKSLQNKDKYLGIYSRGEVVAHELCHVGRMMFEQPRYEEVLAYRTSSSSFRRWLGPLAQSSIESGLFALTLLLVFMLDIFLIGFGFGDIYVSAMWIKLIPAGMLLYGLLRLYRRHQNFNRCLNQLKQLSSEHAEAIIFRLTDGEIEKFAKMDLEKIYAYVREEKSLRWRLIKAAYLGDTRKSADN